MDTFCGDSTITEFKTTATALVVLQTKRLLEHTPHTPLLLVYIQSDGQSMPGYIYWWVGCSEGTTEYKMCDHLRFVTFLFPIPEYII